MTLEIGGMKFPGGAVRMTMPASVANDLTQLQASLKLLAERLGHAQCASGCDIIHLMQERDFSIVVDQDIQINSVLQTSHTPMPLATMPRPTSPRSVEVTIPKTVSSNIEQLMKATAVAMEKFGCPACCSGTDITLRLEEDFLAIDDKLQVQGFGKFR